MGKYERVQYVVGKDSSVLQCGRVSDKTVNVRPNLPGNVIVIHGVNDVGTAYEAVEKGLCEGLKARIGWQYVPGKYRMICGDGGNQKREGFWTGRRRMQRILFSTTPAIFIWSWLQNGLPR